MIDIVPTKEPYYVNESMSGLVMCGHADMCVVDKRSDDETMLRINAPGNCVAEEALCQLGI